MLSLQKYVIGPWEKVRDYILADFELIESTINQRWAATFTDGNKLKVTAGGTGQAKLTTHGVLVGEGANPVVSVVPGAPGTVLTSNGPGADPSFMLTMGLALGLDGADGEDALPIPGPQGPQGLQGPAGPPGLDGESSDDSYLGLRTYASTDLTDSLTGVWTPVLTFAIPGDLAVAYTTQLGRYTKIGRLVFVTWVLVTSSFTYTTASGAVSITGLPFPAKNIAGLSQFNGGLEWQGITHANYTHAYPVVAPGNSNLGVSLSGSGQAVINVQASDMPSGGSVILSGNAFYET